MVRLQKQVEEMVREFLARELEKIGWELYRRHAEPHLKQLERRLDELEQQLQR